MTATVLANRKTKPASRLEPSTSRLPTVFFSYSRTNEPEVQQLLRRLEATCRVRVLIDTQQIHPSEPWEPRLAALIRSADKVVFFISKDSIASRPCSWELSVAEGLGKHVIPAVLQRIEKTDAEQGFVIPPNLQARNFIFFDHPVTYDDGLWSLVAAVEQNIVWIREHTRIGELAYRWNEPRRTNDKLLRGRELLIAERWLATWPPSAPPPTPLHREFIEHSRRIATSFERGLIAALSIVGVSIASLGAWALLKQEEATHQRSIAAKTEERALTSEQIARREEAKAFVQQSQAATRRHETTRGLELAVAAAKVADQATMPEVERALYAAAWGHHEVRRVQLQGVALDAEFDGHGGIIVDGKQERSYYDMRLDWMRSEPYGTKSRSAGIGSLWGLAWLRAPSRDQEPKEQRAWRRVDGDVEVVIDGEFGEDLRIFAGEREIWSTWVQFSTNVMVDSGGRVVVFGAIQDISMNEDTAGTFSGTLKFLETHNPEQQHILGEIETLDRNWRDYVAISPAGDTLAYADPKPSASGQWREPVVINTIPGILSGARGDAGGVRATLGGHGQSLSSLDYSLDGSHILTLTPGGILRLWSPDVFVDESSLASHHGARLTRLGNPFSSPEASTPSPRMRAFHTDVISGMVTIPGGRGTATASLDGKVVHWPNEGVAPVVLYDDADHPAIALAYAASSDDEGVYIVTIDGLYRLGLDGHQQRLATFEDTYSRRDGSYGSGATARVVPGLTSEGPLVEIGTGRGFGLVVDVARREVLWKGHCAERPRVDSRIGTLSCPRVPDELERQEWPMMLYRRGDRLEEHDPYDPLDPEHRHVEVIPVGDCRRAVVGGALFDFEQGREIIRFSDVPALQNAKLEGLPVFCSVEDLVGYSQDLLSRVLEPGRPNPKPEASVPTIASPAELPPPDWTVRPEPSDVDPLALVGKLPTVLLQTPWARVALNDLLGEDLPELESRMEVTSEMQRHGDLVIATGCMAHLCTMEEMALVIEIPTARIHAAILTCPQRIKVYSPKGTRPPAKLESMVVEMRGYAEPECE